MGRHKRIQVVLVPLCFMVGLLGCEATSVPLDPPSDAGTSSDAARPRDDAGPDAGAPDVAGDSGPRLFTARVGTVYGPDPEAFVPTDLSGYRLSARSALGTSTPTIDGPGLLSVWAQGRLELTIASPLRFDTAIVVSTEANYVDLSWSGQPPQDSPPVPRLELTLELSSPWSASDRLRVRTSGGWAAYRLMGQFVIGETNIAGVVVEDLGRGRLLGEDLWVVRERSELTDTGTITRRVDQAVVRVLDRDLASRGIAVRLSPPEGRLPAARWDVSAWRPDGVSSPDRTSVVRYFVRADRFDAAYPGACGSWPVLTDTALFGDGLNGTLPEGAGAPPGYEVCIGASRLSDGPWIDGTSMSLRSETCDCRSNGGPVGLTLGPIQDLRLEGEPLEPAGRAYRAPFTLSWRAPERSIPNGYIVSLNLGSVVIFYVTDQTHATIPADIVPAAARIGPVIEAIEDADRPPIESPFVRSRRFQKSDWAGGLLVPEP